MTDLLAELNAFRVAAGFAELKSWKKARNLPELEAFRAEKAKADKAAEKEKAKADKPAPAPKGTSKKSQVYEMLAKAPTSLEDIAKALSISTVAARSLIGDLRRDSQTIKSHGKGVFSA